MCLSHKWVQDLLSVKLVAVPFKHLYFPRREKPHKRYAYDVACQLTAAPDHDWSDAAWRRCYDPLGRAPVLNDTDGLICRYGNAFSECGDFDVGGWTLEYLLVHHPETVRSMVAGDRESAQRFTIDGVSYGNAICQLSIDHAILPLCNDRDLEDQIAAAIAQFEKVFRRKPLGGWLPEAAVSERVLEAVAAQGIQYLFFRKMQALEFRKIGTDQWIPGDQLDDRRPYIVNLKSGKQLVVLFYNKGISDKMAFGENGYKLVANARDLKGALEGAVDDNPQETQVVTVASDGELYGLHQRDAFMVLPKLAELCDHPDSKIRLLNGGALIALCRRRGELVWEVKIKDNTSWSCDCGLARWHTDCPCAKANKHDPIHQLWRQPIRDAFDIILRDRVHTWFEKEGGPRYFRDPWKARKAFIHYMLARGTPMARARFVEENCQPGLGPSEVRKAIMLMEILWDLMAIYCSCAWYHRTMGLEMGQNMQFAARAIFQLMFFGLDLEESFVQKLRTAPDPETKDGNAGTKWNAETRPYAVVCELRNLIREIGCLPDEEFLARAATLAGVVGTFSDDLVPRHKLRQEVLAAYCNVREQVIRVEQLRDGFGLLARRLGLSSEILEDEYSRRQREAALFESVPAA